MLNKEKYQNKRTYEKLCSKIEKGEVKFFYNDNNDNNDNWSTLEIPNRNFYGNIKKIRVLDFRLGYKTNPFCDLGEIWDKCKIIIFFPEKNNFIFVKLDEWLDRQY